MDRDDALTALALAVVGVLALVIYLALMIPIYIWVSGLR